MARRYTKSERWYEARKEVGELHKQRGHKPSLEATAKSVAVRKLKREHNVKDPSKYPELVELFAKMWLEEYKARNNGKA